ncbi:hypothetical protein Tco_1078269 [Tanacetum coccineum]
MDYGLEYSGDPSVLEGYTDASWITDQEYYASTSGWIFTLGGGAVSWGSKKQSCLTDSTMAAEFVALASCYKEAEWLRDLLINIPLWTKPMPPISVYCDSQSTLSRSYKQVYNGKSRHIGLRHRRVNQLIINGVITERIIKSKRAKTSKNRQETEKTSTRERFEANIKSRIKTVVEKRQESKEKDKSLKEKD